MANYSRATILDEFYYIWGGRWSAIGSTMLGELFASLQQRDAETTTWQDPLDPTSNRLYTSVFGLGLSLDPLGGNILNPQSLNRYSYVLNNPCSLTDPLGLASPCEFHIAINGNGFLTGGDLKDVESKINNIFATSSSDAGLPPLGAVFSFTGPADYTMQVMPFAPPPKEALGTTNAGPGGSPILNSGQMYLGDIIFTNQTQGGSLMLALTLVATHETGHYFLQFGANHAGVLPYSIMAADAAKYMGFPGLDFSYGQVVGLESKCQSLRSRNPGGGGGGRGSAGVGGGGVFINGYFFPTYGFGEGGEIVFVGNESFWWVRPRVHRK